MCWRREGEELLSFKETKEVQEALHLSTVRLDQGVLGHSKLKVVRLQGLSEKGGDRCRRVGIAIHDWGSLRGRLASRRLFSSRRESCW